MSNIVIARGARHQTKDSGLHRFSYPDSTLLTQSGNVVLRLCRCRTLSVVRNDMERNHMADEENTDKSDILEDEDEYWIIHGEVIFFHHVVLRSQLPVLHASCFQIPLKYVVVTRQTKTDSERSGIDKPKMTSCPSRLGGV